MNEPAKKLKLQGHVPTVQTPQALTPMEMVHQAVLNGYAPEILEKLMALQERWQAGQARQAFDEAIAAAKAKIPVITKNRKVDFTSQKGRTNYEYEDLAEIARSVDPILAENGLSYRFRSNQDGSKLTITCIVSHRDGYSEENSLSAENDHSGNKNAIQAIGSTATFLQRYTLKLALGLAAAKDDDAKAAHAPAKITDAQIDELIGLADEAGVDKAKFCAYFAISSFADITTDKFEMAKRAINAKRKKAEASDAGL